MIGKKLVDMTPAELSALSHLDFVERVRAEMGLEAPKEKKEAEVDLSQSQHSDEDLVKHLRRDKPLPKTASLSGVSDGGGDMTDRIEALLLGRSGADFSEAPVAELSDEAVYQSYRDELSGEAGARRHERRLGRYQAEELAFWLEEHKAGNALPRDKEETVSEMGLIPSRA